MAERPSRSAFRDICADSGRTYYQRLRYVVSDHSPRTLAQWRERGLFEQHAAQALLVPADALEPAAALTSAGVAASASARAVFCNYVLDVLPATVWRKRAGAIEELLLGTHLSTEEALRGFTSLTLDEIRRCACGSEPRELLSLLPQLEVEVHFGAAREVERWGVVAKALLEELGEGARLAVNFGALDSLQRCLRCLERQGFVLLNDYGSVGLAGTATPISPQRFGSTLALGLTFPLLERCMTQLGAHVVAPPGDDERPVHTRLLSHLPLPSTEQVLEKRFSAEAERALDAEIVSARQHAAAGRTGDALDAYRIALERVPKDWHLLGEIAEFVGLTVRDFEAGCAIAQRALELNPWTSSWLWNVSGDCHYYQGRFAEAHQAFLQAYELDPSDVRTNLNLGHSFASVAEYTEALTALARGLSHDTGAYRARLLQQQEQVLAALAQRHAALQEKLVRRAERFGSA